ncbi:MAG: amidohydrolase, partial [Terracidiphilus sp.]
MSEAGDTIVTDKFVDLVSATAEVDLRLSDFHPRSALKTPVVRIEQPRFPVIDYHNHLDSMRPEDVLAIMDQCGVERVVNITMQVGQKALDIIDRYHAVAYTRFSSIGWMDWSG